MSIVLLEIDEALAAYETRHQRRPVAIYLGERKLTALTLDVARFGPLPGLSTDNGRPLAYHDLELLRDEVRVDALRVL